MNSEKPTLIGSLTLVIAGAVIGLLVRFAMPMCF